MMRILAGVPSRDRDATFAVKTLQSCDQIEQVVLWSQNSICRVDVKTIESAPSLKCAREGLVQIALKNKFDIILMMDDDIKVPNEVFSRMFEILGLCPSLGVVGNFARQTFYWSKSIESNKPFHVVPFCTQLFAIRIEAIKEFEQSTGELLYDHEILEDIVAALKLWDLGWGSVNFRDKIELCHNPFIPRLKKNPSRGGQPIHERHKKMPTTIQFLQRRFVGPENLLKKASLKFDQSTNQNKFLIRYNWDRILSRSEERFGSIGYEDNKGRKF